MTTTQIEHDEAATAAQSPAPSQWLLAAAALVGAGISVALGAFGRTHRPTGERLVDLGSVSLLSAKAWLATAVLVLVAVQLVSALWLFGRILRSAPTPSWLPAAHRWSGTIAFLVTLPGVAVPAAAPVQLVIADFAFAPVAAQPGQSVDVVNVDGAAHTATSSDGLFDSGSISGNGTGVFVAPTVPGAYGFICAIHPSMQGQLTVSP